jgi:general stress protein 26
MAETTFNDRNRLWELIKDMRFGMFTVRDADGQLRASPMTTQNRKVDEDETLWFFMPRSGDTAAALQHEVAVNVAYADPHDDRYVSVSGLASLREDPQRKQQLWSSAAQAWFPGGVDDPDVALVQVRITQADYWDVRESKVTQLMKMARAVVTGKPPRDLGEHGQVRMR